LKKSNYSVWRDKYILPGQVWEPEIIQKIKDCSVFMVIMSEHSRASKFVAKEIDYAEKFRKRIMPILLSGKPFSKLSKLQYEDMTLGVKLSPKLDATIAEALKETISVKDQMPSLQAYTAALEEALSQLHNKPMIADIVKYQNQLKLFQESIKERLTPLRAPFDKDRIEEIQEALLEWQSLAYELRNYAVEINDEYKEIEEKIEELAREWEDHPNALELPQEPPINNPTMYNSDLFGDS
jgi:hypothetical protein